MRDHIQRMFFGVWEGVNLGKVFHWILNGNEWEPMVTNGKRIAMVNHWESLHSIFYHSLLMGDQLNITGNIVMVLITIHL